MKQMGGTVSPRGKQMAQEAFDSCSTEIQKFKELGGVKSIQVLQEGLVERICRYAKVRGKYTSTETGLRYLVEKVECVEEDFKVTYCGRSGEHRGFRFCLPLLNFIAIRPDGSPAFSLLPEDD